MKIAGFEIEDAYEDKTGVIKLRHARNRSVKKRVFAKPEERFEVFNRKSLKKLCMFHEFLRYNRINVQKISLGVLRKLAGNYFKCSFNSSTAFDYAYAIWYLSL